MWDVPEMSVEVFPVGPDDEAAFLAAVRRSTPLFGRWIAPPGSSETFAAHLNRCSTELYYSFLAKAADGSLIGCINLNDVVRQAFQSASLAYYAFAPNQGKGLMKEALSLVISLAFTELELHRLEANIQPANSRSLGLVQSLGFRREGYSPRYIRIGGAWRGHERYAITAEEWDAAARSPRDGSRGDVKTASRSGRHWLRRAIFKN